MPPTTPLPTSISSNSNSINGRSSCTYFTPTQLSTGLFMSTFSGSSSTTLTVDFIEVVDLIKNKRDNIILGYVTSGDDFITSDLNSAEISRMRSDISLSNSFHDLIHLKGRLMKIMNNRFSFWKIFSYKKMSLYLHDRRIRNTYFLGLNEEDIEFNPLEYTMEKRRIKIWKIKNKIENEQKTKRSVL